MSKTLEQKIVEMRFDNKHFEKHAKESLSTLEKLKQKLKLKDASKGLENLNKSANRVDMRGMSSALDSVSSKFSALEVMGVTTLANITNSAVNAGKRMVKALTIDPIMDGFSEYEMTLNAIQTTMAATGKTSKEVEKELKKLDEYADKTVYSTADMLNNLPKFTNAGVELESATKAMIGIANATALAGGDAGKASIAFYNLGQAIGTGYLTRMDYNSINNAGIATMEWKNQMVEAAIAAGTLVQVGEDLYDTGSSQLSLQQLFIEGLQDQWATTDVMMSVFEAYGDETTEIGKKSYAAAQDIKTFSMMMDSLKATAGTGWKDTWQIIFGDLEEAKEFWTGLTNFIGRIITGMANFRNSILEGALGKSFRGLLDNVKKPFKEIEKTVESIKDYTKVVDEIISGKWGNTEKRWNALTEAGYDWAHAQNLVNEKLGVSLRRATTYNETQNEIVKQQEKTNETTTEYLVSLAKLSDAELEAALGGKKQAESFRELQKVAKKTGIPLKEFIENIDEIDGRWLLINSFKNAGQGLVAVFKAMKDAWLDIFPVSGAANGLFNIIAGLHKFSTYLTVSERAADNLRDTFKGVFAILDMVFTIIGGPVKLALKLFMQLFKAFDIGAAGILEFTGGLGRGISKIHEWVESIFDFTEVFRYLVPYIKTGANTVKEFVKSLAKSDAIKRFGDFLRKTKDSIIEWVKGIKDAKSIPKYIFQGLLNGLSSGAKGVIDFVINLGKQILVGIKKVLGIHSPSTAFYEIGKNIVQGLFNGISDFIKMVYTLVMSVGGKIIEIVKNLDIGSIFTIAIGTTSVIGFLKLAEALDRLTSPLESVDDILKQFKKTVKAFNGVMKSVKLKILAESVKSFAVAIAILAGSIVVLTMVDQGKMWSAVGAIAVLAVVLGGLTAVAGKFGGKEGVQFGKMALTILALGVSMIFMAKALKTISKIENGGQAIAGFAVAMAGLILLMVVVNKNEKGFLKLGSAFMGIASALLVMGLVVKILGKMDRGELIQGGLAIVAFGIIITGLMAATKLLTGSKNVDKIANTIAKVGSAILMMAIVAKLLGGMNEYELKQGVQAIMAFSGIIVGLMAATKLIGGSKNVDKIGKAIFGISGALLMMVFVAKIAAGMEYSDILKGTLVIAAFGGIIVGLMAATKLLTGSKNVDKIGKTMISISVAIGIMAISAALLSLIDTNNLIKGVTAVGVLSALVMGLIAVTSIAKNIKGTMIAITVAIGILALSVGLLALIKPEKLWGATAALSILLGMFALVIGISSMATKAMGTLIVLTVAIGVLAGALYLIATLPIEKTMAATLSLTTLLLSLTVALAVLSVVGNLGPAAFIGIGALVTLIAALTAAFIGIGYLMDKVPELEGFLDKGLSTLIKIAGGLGEMVGAFVGGALAQISNSLPVIATNLSLFMMNLTPFIVGAKMVDVDTLAGVGILAASILLLTAANLISGIGSFLSLGSSFADLGTQLSQFMINALPFITTAMMIPPGVVDSVKALAETILILTVADLLDGIHIFSKTPLEKFADQLPTLATGIKNFLTELGVISPDQVSTAQNAAKIIKTLAQAASELPNTGGLLGSLVGNNDMAPWAAQLPIMALGIANFIKTIKDAEIDTSSVELANTAAQIIKTLAQAASEIPNTGGLLADLIGDNDLTKFAAGLPIVAFGIAGFVKTLKDAEITKDDVTIANAAAKIIKTLAKAASEVPNTGGLLADLIGDNDLTTFAEGLPDIGTAIANFVGELGEFTPEQITTVDSACKAIKSIAQLGKIDIENTGDGLNTFGKNIVNFAKKVKTFVEHIGEVGSKSIDSAIKKTKELVEMAKTVASTNVSSLKTFGESLKKVAKDGVKGFVKEFSGNTPKSDAKKATQEMMDSAIKGLESKKDEIKKAAKKASETAVDAMCTKALKSDAKSAGKDLVQGLINGLNDADKRSQVYKAAFSLGQLAVQGEKDGQQSNSPSKATEQAGMWLGEGLVIGIQNMGRRVYNAGKSMGQNATNSISNALSTAMNLMNSDMDTQPTIRPVLDLSDVESGAGYLSSMFSNSSLGVTSNLNAISRGMRSRNQNGTNDDVVSAINNLNKKLDNVSGDTYNVNGITYDDGSNITDAVRTLVRAATMERRV